MSETNLAESIDRAKSYRLTTLIIGAGVAGLTLAALMRQRGESPVINAPPTGSVEATCWDCIQLDRVSYMALVYTSGIFPEAKL